MDQFLLAAKNLAEILLPSLGAIVLIYLAIVLRKLAKVMDNVNVTMTNAETTVKLVNKSIEKAQAPLDTAVKLSHTVDDVHDSTIETVKSINESTQKFVNENIDVAKDYIGSLKNKKNSNEEILDDVKEEITITEEVVDK
jgi:uncharacterized protein YoxC